MTSRVRVLGLSVVLLVTLLGTPSSRSAASAVSTTSTGLPVQVLGLQPDDTPPGFFVLDSRVVPNEQVAKLRHESLADVMRSGRIAGYSAEFGRDTGRGVFWVAHELVQYAHPSQAEASFRGDLQYVADYRHSPDYTQLVNPATGTQVITFLCACPGDLSPTWVVLLDSHSGPYFWNLELHYFAGTVAPQTVTRQILGYSTLIKHRLVGGPLAGTSPGHTPPVIEPRANLSRPHGLTVWRCLGFGIGLADQRTGHAACVEYQGSKGAHNYSGYLNVEGQAPPKGDIYLHLWVGEFTAETSSPYQSMLANFRLRGKDGKSFATQRGAPFRWQSFEFHPSALTRPNSQNIGYVEYVVPEHDGPYTLMWNERGTDSINPVAAIPVFPR